MRFILKQILKSYSKWAIRKHDIDLVIVTGWTGVELVKEGIYFLLNEKFQVRRNTNQVWWDLSLPLNILGYSDERRDVKGWIELIIKSLFVLITGPKNPHTLILSANSEHTSTVKYWKEFIKPDYLVIIQNKKKSPVTSKLIQVTKRNAGIIIFEEGEVQEKSIPRKFIFGKDKSSKVKYSVSKTNITISYKDEKIVIPKELLPPYARNIVAAIVSFGITRGFSFEEISSSLLKFDLRHQVLEKIVDKIKEEK